MRVLDKTDILSIIVCVIIFKCERDLDSCSMSAHDTGACIFLCGVCHIDKSQDIHRKRVVFCLVGLECLNVKAFAWVRAWSYNVTLAIGGWKCDPDMFSWDSTLSYTKSIICILMRCQVAPPTCACSLTSICCLHSGRCESIARVEESRHGVLCCSRLNPSRLPAVVRPQ